MAMNNPRAAKPQANANGKKTAIKSLIWLTAITVGVFGFLFLKYSNEQFIRTQEFLNLISTMPGHSEAVFSSQFNDYVDDRTATLPMGSYDGTLFYTKESTYITTLRYQILKPSCNQQDLDQAVRTFERFYGKAYKSFEYEDIGKLYYWSKRYPESWKGKPMQEGCYAFIAQGKIQFLWISQEHWKDEREYLAAIIRKKNASGIDAPAEALVTKDQSWKPQTTVCHFAGCTENNYSYRNELYCPKHQCEVCKQHLDHDIPSIIHEKIPYCEDHVCNREGCTTKIDYDTYRYCRFDLGRIYREGFTLRNNYCAFATCKNKTIVRGYFCLEHTCSEPGCVYGTKSLNSTNPLCGLHSKNPEKDYAYSLNFPASKNNGSSTNIKKEYEVPDYIERYKQKYEYGYYGHNYKDAVDDYDDAGDYADDYEDYFSDWDAAYDYWEDHN